MKTIETNCQVCGSAMKIEILDDDENFITEEFMESLATCDRCYYTHTQSDRDRIAKYHKAIEREVGEYRKPYAD